MEPRTPYSTPIKGSGGKVNQASLGLNIATKFKLKAQAAKHRLDQKKMDEIIESTSVLVAVRVRPMNKREIRAKNVFSHFRLNLVPHLLKTIVPVCYYSFLIFF